MMDSALTAKRSAIWSSRTLSSSAVINRQRIDELNASLQRERVELAAAQSALKMTRKDYARPQRDMLAGREAPRRKRSAPLEEVSKEPSKSKNGSGDGRGPNAVEVAPEGGAAEPSSTR